MAWVERAQGQRPESSILGEPPAKPRNRHQLLGFGALIGDCLEGDCALHERRLGSRWKKRLRGCKSTRITWLKSKEERNGLRLN